MLLDEKIFESEELSQRIEFSTEQSSNRQEQVIRYKNINRKLIVFDFSDTQLMLALAKALQPYGLKENFENKMIQSKVSVFRIWAEKKLINRAKNFICLLFLKHPEKFTKIEYEHVKSRRMKMEKCSYILSELTSQKSFSLKDNSDEEGDLRKFKAQFTDEQQRLILQENAIKDFKEN